MLGFKFKPCIELSNSPMSSFSDIVALCFHFFFKYCLFDVLCFNIFKSFWKTLTALKGKEKGIFRVKPLI